MSIHDLPDSIKADFESVFQAIFKIYNTPGYRFESDTAWAIHLNRLGTDVLPAAQRVRAALANPENQ